MYKRTHQNVVVYVQRVAHLSAIEKKVYFPPPIRKCVTFHGNANDIVLVIPMKMTYGRTSHNRALRRR